MYTLRFLSALCVVLIWHKLGLEAQYTEHEYTPYDGWFNNRVHPGWGGAETQLLRRLPAVYRDGTYEPAGSLRPNPIMLSDALMNGSTGFPSYQNRTALLVFFGQQVVEEILDAQRPGCPPEYFNIEIPPGHAKFDPDNHGDRYIPFLRSRYDQRTGINPNNPRQQLNEISSFIDGTLFYGPNKAWADALRSYEGGRLAATNDTDPNEGYWPAYNDIRLPMANPPPPRDHWIKPVKRFFKLGNPRGNENPFLLTFGIMWFRYHNFKARQLQHNHPTWSDERLFNEARKWTIGVYQKIVMYDWLPQWLGQDPPVYTGYDPVINPGIVQEFQSAAMRFGHTLVPPGVYRRDASCNFQRTTTATKFDGHRGIRTCNAYWNGQESIRESDIDSYLMGMASQITEREDNIITPDLRQDVFGPLEFSRRDLMAINIQRARDHGLPDYNTARQEYGLPRITAWNDINPGLAAEKPEIFQALEDLYNNEFDNIDIWAAGILETLPTGPGPLFRAIIQDQFVRVRNGDRFWYENNIVNNLFTDAEIQEINATTLKQVILEVTDIPDSAIQDNPFFWLDGDPCPQPKQLEAHNLDDLSECVGLQHFDYFTGSEVPYIASFTGIGVYLILCIVAMIACANIRRQTTSKQKAVVRQKTARAQSARMPIVAAVEWVGHKEGDRDVFVKFDNTKNRIVVQSKQGQAVRQTDFGLLSQHDDVIISTMITQNPKRPMILVKIPKEYDLVLRFDDEDQRAEFMQRLDAMLNNAGVRYQPPTHAKEGSLKKQALTKAERGKMLEKFLRITFAHAFKYDSDDGDLQKLNAKEAKEILGMELTKVEFGEAMGLKANSTFVVNMFGLIDKDGNGYVSFREFLDMIVIFAKGSANDKARLMFDMYDVDQTGELDRDEFKGMMRSLMEMGNEELDDAKANEVIDSLFKAGGYENTDAVTFEQFAKMLNEYEKELNYASLDWNKGGDQKGAPRAPSRARKTKIIFDKSYDDEGSQGDLKKGRRHSLEEKLHDHANLAQEKRNYPKSPLAQKMNAISSWFEKNRLQVFWGSLYTLLTLAIFAERAYYYSIEREHRGLRRIAGYGITTTRGAASAIMWTYSTILVTMCRNTITFCRETFLAKWIPFDSAIAMHKFIAFQAFVFSLVHIFGHTINFYHIATQTADDLTCLFRDYFHATDELPKFTFWLYSTVTGFTGFLLVVVFALIFIFAIEYSRRNIYKVFWLTHHLYVIGYFLTVLHGAGRLVQPPFFHYFFLGPVIWFTLDKLVSVTRKHVEIAVLKAELLPSDVTVIEFKKPNNFSYKSGQWARIACLAQSPNEYHPFTLTSAPHEETLSMHIRAVGPWTTNLRKVYDPNNLKNDNGTGIAALPKIYLDGPYGEGHQDWYKYDVAVLVGGGIGVTPFASILKDLTHQSQIGTKIKCKKVYFLWVTRTQKQFEWMTDIIRNVEENDTKDMVAVHIFITQFREKFDIRTTMLYICERHFQKISNRSLLTGLKSVTHFGRPDFACFLQQLLQQHQKTSVFGVFSCGPPPMTSSVEQACSQVNKTITNALFVHHYENF